MKNAYFFRALLLLALLSSVPALAQDHSLVFERAKTLKHGINLSMWFAQSGDYSPQRLNAYTNEADFALVEKLHFDHVRLSIDPAPLLKEPLTNGLNADHLALLDVAVHGLLAHHLSVLIDIHPASDYKKQINTDDAALDRFSNLWSALAAHYSTYDPNHIFFEIMNEPETTTTVRILVIEKRIVATIRAVAPNHTIIATGALWSGLSDLLEMTPLDDPNIVYTFHYYDPMNFTHQGANWAGDKFKPLRTIPYPSTPTNIKENLAQETAIKDQFWLENYGLDQWNANRIKEQISFARRWAERYNVPLLCGEFGVYIRYADPSARAAWIHDTRTALELNGIGWTMWDYQGTFALVTKKNGVTAADPAILKALGLN